MAIDTLAVGEQINWCEFPQFIRRKCLNWIFLLVAPEAFNVRVFHFWSAPLNHAAAACYVRRHARQRSCQGALNAKWDMCFHGKWITSKFLFRFMRLDWIFGGGDSLIEKKKVELRSAHYSGWGEFAMIPDWARMEKDCAPLIYHSA